MSVESTAPSLPAPGLPTPSLPPAGTVAISSTSTLATPTLAAPTGAASAPSTPTLTTPTLTTPALAVPTLAAPILAARTEVAAGVPLAVPTLPAAPARANPSWKPIQRSKARKALNGLIGIGVFAALVVGARFAYQSLAPAEDTTTPTTLLIDNPDTFVGQANAVVNQINAQAPDQEVLDVVGVESEESPPAPDAPATTTP